ncbi:MAG: serine hydrolase domain-containing protein [Fimbriimonadaceae bacterium]
MPRSRWLVLLAALPCLVFPQAREEAVRKALADYIASNTVVGASVAIVKPDGTQFAAGAGFQDRESSAAATDKTIYRLGSISKPVTTIAALKLVEEGKLSLFTRVRTYVPELPEAYAPVTLRHLLTHTSGVRHYIAAKRDVFYKRFTVSESVGVFKDDPLIFPTGERVSYSTHAFSLVARLVEVASGQEFGAYVRANVATPSGSPTLALEDRSATNPHRSKLYTIQARAQSALVTQEEDISWKSGGGGMESSAPDLARFGLAAMTGKLLGKQLTDFMFQKQTVDGLATGGGLTWSFGPHGQPEHGGAQQGCRTLMVLDREHGTVYVVMTNTGGNHPVGQLMAAVMTAWGERKIQSP